jgi:DegV family protein with EDD domain
MVPRVHAYVVLETLEFLRRGGRIGRAAAFLGSVLDVKPILALRDGVIHPIARVRTRKRAVDKMLEVALGHPDITDVAVLHGTTPDDAQALAKRVSDKLPGVPVHLGFIGPVIGVHGGPGIVGIVVVMGEHQAG